MDGLVHPCGSMIFLSLEIMFASDATSVVILDGTVELDDHDKASLGEAGREWL
jgi:hypothetical protein